MTRELPLTFQQQWLWSLLREYPRWKSMVAYAFRLQGTLSIETLEQCLEDVTVRHESLRSIFVAKNGTASQWVDESRRFRLDVASVSGDSAAEREANARAQVEEFGDHEVDPAEGPLLNARLLKLNDREHWLLLAVHRLIADCASIDQIAQELWTAYGRRIQELPDAPASNSNRYIEYVQWQSDTHSDWQARHRSYWEQRLAGAVPLTWPSDGGTAGAARGKLGSMNVWFEPDLSEALHTVARKARTLAATTMLVAYIAVLWRWCGQRDFVVPFNVAGRQTEHRAVVGYFSHILLLRVQLNGDETFAGLMRTVSNELFRGLMHQDLGRIATESAHLLTGTYFQWITWHVGEENVTRVPDVEHPHALSVERVAVRDFGEGLTAIPPGMVDVEITFFDTTKGIFASGVYRADRFKPETLKRFMDDLHATVRQLVHDPAARIA